MFLIFRRQGRPLCDVTGFVIIGWSIELGFAGGSLGCNKDMSYFWQKVDYRTTADFDIEGFVIGRVVSYFKVTDGCAWGSRFDPRIGPETEIFCSEILCVISKSGTWRSFVRHLADF